MNEYMLISPFSQYKGCTQKWDCCGRPCRGPNLEVGCESPCWTAARLRGVHRDWRCHKHPPIRI